MIEIDRRVNIYLLYIDFRWVRRDVPLINSRLRDLRNDQWSAYQRDERLSSFGEAYFGNFYFKLQR